MTKATTHWILTLVCRDQPGIVHAISGAIVQAAGNITESQQFSSADTGTFFMRLQVESAIDAEGFETAITPVTTRYGMTWQLDVVGRRLRTLVLVSKAGHCPQRPALPAARRAAVGRRPPSSSATTTS